MNSSPPFGWSCLVLCAALIGSGIPAFGQFPDAPRDALPPLPERRAAVLKEFDKDGDGRLTGSEREDARKAWAAKQLAKRRDRGFFGPPPEIMAEFDTNKDGELDEAEGRLAGETMEKRFKQLQKDYDRNGNGQLDPDEIEAASKAIDEGKLKGIPKMFLRFAGGGPSRRGPPRRPGTGSPTDEELSPAEFLRQADRDGDGRLSGPELETVRKEWARRRAEKAKQNPALAKPAETTPP